MLRKCTFLLPRSHLIRQFVKRHLVTIRREQHVLAQWLRQYFCQDHCVRSVGRIQTFVRGLACHRHAVCRRHTMRRRCGPVGESGGMPPRVYFDFWSQFLVTSRGYLNNNFHVVFMRISVAIGYIYRTKGNRYLGSVNVQPTNHQNNANRPTLIATP